jgi:hypothetical protein
LASVSFSSTATHAVIVDPRTATAAVLGLTHRNLSSMAASLFPTPSTYPTHIIHHSPITHRLIDHPSTKPSINQKSRRICAVTADGKRSHCHHTQRIKHQIVKGASENIMYLTGELGFDFAYSLCLLGSSDVNVNQREQSHKYICFQSWRLLSSDSFIEPRLQDTIFLLSQRLFSRRVGRHSRLLSITNYLRDRLIIISQKWKTGTPPLKRHAPRAHLQAAILQAQWQLQPVRPATA